MVTARGAQMKIIGSSHTIARCNDRKSEIKALIAQDLAHNMLMRITRNTHIILHLAPNSGIVNSRDHTPLSNNLREGTSQCAIKTHQTLFIPPASYEVKLYGEKP